MYSNLSNWVDVSNKCNWYIERYSSSIILINYTLHIILFSIIGSGVVNNQADIVTIAGIPENANVIMRGMGTSETSGVSIDVPSTSFTLRSSHSVNVQISNPKYVGFGYYTT